MRVVEDDTKTEDAIPYWKIDDFLGFPGFSWVWVVLTAARAKKVETKRFYTPPLGGKKTQAFLVAPPKGSFVGWLVIWEGERGIEERVERSSSARLSVMLVSHFHRICGVPTRPRSSMGRALKFFKSHVENFGAPKIEQAGL